MTRLSWPRTIAAVAIAAAATAAAAGCSPQDYLASSPDALSTQHSPKPHGTHTAKPRHSNTPSPVTSAFMPSSTPTTPAVTPVTSVPASTPSSASATSAPAPTGSCRTSAAKGQCGPYVYPQIQGTSQDPIVGQDVWNSVPGWQQTLYADSPGHWSVTANMPGGNTAVVSYPSSESLYGERALSSFSTIFSSFSETMNTTSKTSAWASYDIWLNNWNNEIMIQHDSTIASCAAVAAASFGGSGGVPVRSWDLCKYGSELIWKLTGSNEQSGSVDILAMLTWLENHGYVPKASKLTDISYGWEICSTGGANENFQVSSYSITAS
jgi:hypothetical protein